MNLISKIFKKEDNFGIVVSKNSDFNIAGVQQYREILRLGIDKFLKVKPLLTQGDPFLLVKSNTLYLFFESLRADECGVIRMMKTENLKDWTPPVTVLQEPFHLSFPFVFEYHGSVYMIPETQEADSIRLYKGNEDLTQFSFEQVLITKNRNDDVKFNYCDSHIIEKDGIFYLFTSVSYNWTYHLELYYTDNLMQHNFVEHPKSPIYIGNDFGRSGGSIIHLDDNYYRISQNCCDNYGSNFSIHRVLELDKEEYLEELCYKDLLKVKNDIYHDGGHQLNVVKYGDDYIYATDYRKLTWHWYELYLKLRDKFR